MWEVLLEKKKKNPILITYEYIMDILNDTNNSIIICEIHRIMIVSC